MTHLSGGTGANGQVAQILENQSCIRESILPRTSGACGGRSKVTDIHPRKSDFSVHANLMMVRGEPNSSFYVIQTNRERIEVIAAIRPSGKRKIWADPRSRVRTH